MFFMNVFHEFDEFPVNKKKTLCLAFSKVLTSRYKCAVTVHQPLNGLYLMAGYYSAKPWQELRTLRVKGAE